MSSTLLISGLSSQINTLDLKRVFEAYGPCLFEVRGDQALVQYQNEKNSSTALNYLNNTNLLGLNQGIVSADFAYLNEPSEQNERILAPRSVNTLGNVNQNLDGKISPNFGGAASSQYSFQGNYMNENLNPNPFYSQNLVSSQNQQPLKPISNNAMNIENKSSNSMAKKPEVLKPMDHPYLKSTTNPSAKLSSLVDIYKTYFQMDATQSAKAKLLSTRAMSNILPQNNQPYREFSMDQMSFVPKPKEQESPAHLQLIKDNQELMKVNLYTLSYFELQNELSKRGIKANGPKQALIYTLERALLEN